MQLTIYQRRPREPLPNTSTVFQLNKKKQQKRVLLIDGDTLVYAAALNAERAIEWDNDLWTLHAYLPEAIDKFNDILAGIKEVLKPDDIIMALSDPFSENRWRNEVMPTYKIGRKKSRRPVVYTPLRAWVHETFETFEREGLEGDDVLGILATRSDPHERIVVSIDKDLKTIPGLLFNYGKPEEGIAAITEDEADYYHLFQTLTGDATDGYPGCPGIGPVSATKILDPFWTAVDGETWFDGERAWGAVEKAYAKAGLSEDVALMNARVARICRADDYDFVKKQVIHWHP